MDVQVIHSSIQTAKSHLGTCNPRAAFILGSGWDGATSEFKPIQELSYSELPALGQTSVTGHSGQVSLCEYEGRQVLVFRGRRHVFEGVDNTALCFPSLLIKALNIPVVMVTNAAGSLNKTLCPGDVMLITDHINMLGTNPLIGADRDLFPEVFIDMSEPYDLELRGLMAQSLETHNIKFHEGVYAAVHGPSYETKAEVKMIGSLGAQAVGMSTVPTVICSRALGIKVIGMSCITNFGTGIGDSALHHGEVLEIGQELMPKMTKVFSDLLKKL